MYISGVNKYCLAFMYVIFKCLIYNTITIPYFYLSDSSTTEIFMCHGTEKRQIDLTEAIPLGDIISIQGDSGGICNTLGNDSMCDSKQKSSYEH